MTRSKAGSTEGRVATESGHLQVIPHIETTSRDSALQDWALTSPVLP